MLGGLQRQGALPQELFLLEVVDGGPVGQHHRGVHRQVLLLHLDGEVTIGAPGGDGEQPPLLHKVADGGAVFLGNASVV